MRTADGRELPDELKASEMTASENRRNEALARLLGKPGTDGDRLGRYVTEPGKDRLPLELVPADFARMMGWGDENWALQKARDWLKKFSISERRGSRYVWQPGDLRSKRPDVYEKLVIDGYLPKPIGFDKRNRSEKRTPMQRYCDERVTLKEDWRARMQRDAVTMDLTIAQKVERFSKAHPGPGSVYFVTDCIAVKVGHTTKSIQERLLSLQTATYRDIEVISLVAASRETEQYIHAQLDEHRIKREWFAPSEETMSLAHGWPELAKDRT